MGLFSSTKRVYVSSTAYNLAGDLTTRSSYLKNTVAYSVLGPQNKATLGDKIVKAQLEGPTMSQRSFFRWANANYPNGKLQGNLSGQLAVDPAVVGPFISIPLDHVLHVELALVDSGDITYWAQKHILETNPALYDTDWVVDFDDALNQMVITYADTSTENVIVSDYDQSADWVFAYYASTGPDTQTVFQPGSGAADDPVRPDTAGWTANSFVETPEIFTWIERIRTTVDDGVNPPVVTDDDTTHNDPWTKEVSQFERETQLGPDPVLPRLNFLVERIDLESAITGITIWETISDTTDGGGVRTLVERRYVDYALTWTWALDTADLYKYDQVENSSIFMYKIGTGNATLDALKTADVVLDSEFFPVIPLRVNNVMIDEPALAADLPIFSKAYKRVMGTKIEDLLVSLYDNANLADIDYATLVFGVEVNTLEPEGLRYIYEFFRKLITYQQSSLLDVTTWIGFNDTYATAQAALIAWRAAQGNSGDPLYGTPQPSLPDRTVLDQSVLRLQSTGSTAYDVRLSWLGMGETIHAGLGKVGAVKGEMWWEVEPVISVPDTLVYNDWTGTPVTNSELSHTVLYWQDGDATYRRITCYGLLHTNMVYGGKSVITDITDALGDVNESGFIIPLHYPTLKEMPLVMQNQVAQSNRIVVFNAYQVVTIRWYQRSIFKIIFSIVIVIVSAIAFPGAVGLLGSNLALGASLGFSGTTALIAGALVNAVAAMVLMAVIEVGATAILGDKLGSIVSVIASVLTLNAINNFTMNGNLAINWGELTRAENLIKISNSVSGAVQKIAVAEIGEIADKLEVLGEDYERDSARIQKEMMELLGYGGVDINPLMFLQTQGSSSNFSMESSDDFLNRTLLVGSDIAEMSLDMISSFPDLTLKPDLLIT